MLSDFRLQVFNALVLCGSFTKAAEALGVTQPAVSQNIAELEKELGVQLFLREKGGITLTEEGEKFKGYCDQILHWYAAASNAFSASEELAQSASKPVEIKLSENSRALIWASQGDIHIKLD